MSLRVARWYFDADTIGVGKILSGVRRDVTWPGDDGTRARDRNHQAPCPVEKTDVPDEVWIRTVTEAGMTIVTRDKKIQTRTSEITAVRDTSARMFAITSEGSLDRWGLLEVVVSQWRSMERIVEERSGPFVFALTRTGVREIDIDPQR